MPADKSAHATITVTERHLSEVRSAGADVFVSIEERRAGSKTSGRVVDLRRSLEKRGLTEQDMMLEGAESSSWAWIPIPFAVGCGAAALASDTLRLAALPAAAGLVVIALILSLMKLGTLTARLKIRCADAERVNAVLDTVLTFPGAHTQSIAWRFETDPDAREAWTAEAVRRAQRRAERIASELKVRIVGVHALHEDCETPPRPAGPMHPAVPSEVAPAKKRMAASVDESIGPAPSNTTQVLLTVSIQYCVAPVSETAGDAAGGQRGQSI